MALDRDVAIRNLAAFSTKVEKMVVAEAGDIHHWASGDYRKVEGGGWEKVKAGEEGGASLHEMSHEDRESVVSHHEGLASAMRDIHQKLIVEGGSDASVEQADDDLDEARRGGGGNWRPA